MTIRITGSPAFTRTLRSLRFAEILAPLLYRHCPTLSIKLVYIGLCEG